MHQKGVCMDGKCQDRPSIRLPSPRSSSSSFPSFIFPFLCLFHASDPARPGPRRSGLLVRDAIERALLFELLSRESGRTHNLGEAGVLGIHVHGAKDRLDDVPDGVLRQWGTVHLRKLLLASFYLGQFGFQALDFHSKLNEEIVHVVDGAFPVQAIVRLLSRGK